MRITGKFKDILQDRQGNGIASFLIENLRNVSLLKELDTEKTYSIDIKEVRSKRSIEQNKYLWYLMHEIDVVMNGERANDEWSIYIMALERAGAKFEYIGALPETEELLKENFRAIKFIKKIDLNGKEGNMYKCFIGSSKMDTKEFRLLIETALDMAEEVGIDTTLYSEILR